MGFAVYLKIKLSFFHFFHISQKKFIEMHGSESDVTIKMHLPNLNFFLDIKHES